MIVYIYKMRELLIANHRNTQLPN